MSKRKWTREEVNDYREKHGYFFYCNKEDANFLVPKAYGIGWTVNWANPVTWFWALVIIGFIIWQKYTG